MLSKVFNKLLRAVFYSFQCISAWSPVGTGTVVVANWSIPLLYAQTKKKKSSSKKSTSRTKKKSSSNDIYSSSVDENNNAALNQTVGLRLEALYSFGFPQNIPNSSIITGFAVSMGLPWLFKDVGGSDKKLYLSPYFEGSQTEHSADIANINDKKVNLFTKYARTSLGASLGFIMKRQNLILDLEAGYLYDLNGNLKYEVRDTNKALMTFDLSSQSGHTGISNLRLVYIIQTKFGIGLSTGIQYHTLKRAALSALSGQKSISLTSVLVNMGGSFFFLL